MGRVIWIRLNPYRTAIRQARLFREHPWAARLFCALNHLRWRGSYFVSYLYLTDGSRFEHRLIAVERMTTYRELLRAANQLKAYSLRKRVRTEVMRPSANGR